MVKPISPAEAVKQFQDSIPEEVFEAFNELIVENTNRSGSAYFTNDVLLPRIKAKLTASGKNTTIQSGWLWVEEHYKKVGWKVDIDRASYCEDYSTIYSFKPLKNPSSATY